MGEEDEADTWEEEGEGWPVSAPGTSGLSRLPLGQKLRLYKPKPNPWIRVSQILIITPGYNTDEVYASEDVSRTAKRFSIFHWTYFTPNEWLSHSVTKLYRACIGAAEQVMVLLQLCKRQIQWKKAQTPVLKPTSSPNKTAKFIFFWYGIVAIKVYLGSNFRFKSLLLLF